MKKIFAIIQIICVALFLANIYNIVKEIKKKNWKELNRSIIISVILIVMTIGCYFFSK